MTSGRKSKKKRAAGGGHSTLKDHRQQGKILRAPINTVGPVTHNNWLKDVLPSLIWQCSLLHHDGMRVGTTNIAGVMDKLEQFVPKRDDGRVATVLDGTLECFDAVPEDRREEALRALKADGLYEEAFPWLLVRALSKYTDVPGSWVLQGWDGNEQIVPEDAPARYVADAIIGAWHGRSEVATRAKMLYFRGYINAGLMHFPEGMRWVELLPRYPHDLTDDKRRMVEASGRATFLTLWATRHIDTPHAEDWAPSFWRQNWSLYECKTEDPNPSETSTPSDDEPPWQRISHECIAQLRGIDKRFRTAHGAADPDLYSPERNEVLTGLVYRQIRSVFTLAHTPAMWSVEHGAGVVRSLIEARIIHKWLIHKDDPALYARFKDYSRGRLKLQVLHLREYCDDLDNPPNSLTDTISALEDLVNRDIMEEFQDISIEGNFAKTDVRRMAQAVGLEREYRLVFAPMSADVHGEWTSLDRYALTVCRNPLHRAHRIPAPLDPVRIGPDLVDLAIQILDTMVSEYVEAISRTGGADVVDTSAPGSKARRGIPDPTDHTPSRCPQSHSGDEE